MPKQIPNLQEEILSRGKKLLLEDGYERFTIRSVAGHCGIASGTIYNYYSSKEHLIASIMLEDWKKVLDNMKESIEKTILPLERAKLLYDSVCEFAALYSPIWRQYKGNSIGFIAAPDWHRSLIDEVRSITGLNAFAVEIIIHFTTVCDITFEALTPDLVKIL